MKLISVLFIIFTSIVIDMGNSINFVDRMSIRSCSGSEECLPRYQCSNRKIKSIGTKYCGENSDSPDRICCLPKSVAERCGIINTNDFNVVTDENLLNKASFGEFPWMVSIKNKVIFGGVTFYPHKCGGTIIHPMVILTVAHCVKYLPINELKIRAGLWELGRNITQFPYQDRFVREIIIHDDYNDETIYRNNIALIFLIEPIRLMSYVNTICLPPQSPPSEYVNCIATGWGKVKTNGNLSRLLKRLKFPIITHSQCFDSVHQQLGGVIHLDESTICAISDNKLGLDLCLGDGGSTLMCNIKTLSNDVDDQYFQAGIVASGFNCEGKLPGFFTNVAMFRNWIDGVFEKNHLDNSYYLNDN